MTCRTTLALLLAFAFVSARAGGAETISLNGPWRLQRNDRPSPESLADEWREESVPSVLYQQPDRYSWYRRRFQVPGSWRGRHVFLRFGGVRFAPRIWVNGREAGGHWGGWEPFELDVTEMVRFGEPNVVTVRVSDARGVIKGEAPFRRHWDIVQEVDRRVTAPVGFHPDWPAIWGDVELVARPDLYIRDVAVRTSVERGELTVRVAVSNLAEAGRAVSLEGSVLDGEHVALSLGPNEAQLAAGAASEVVLRRDWPDPRPWSPRDPHLYRLRLHLRGSEGERDSRTVRFGFREFRVDGTKLVLNGTPVNFLATSRPGMPQLHTRAEIEETYRRVKAANCVAVRLHAQVWPELWLEVADEMGVLVVEESAVWCRSRNYALDDPVFWERFREHWRRLVRRDRNHPSVVMYSIENELMLCNPHDPESTERRLAELGRFVKELDPTRPIMFDGDLDPGGVADVLNLHYPHEFPRHQLYPDTAYWLERPTRLDNYPRRVWEWDRRKPLYIGEFLHSHFDRAEPYTLLVGREAFEGQRARDRAKARAWEMQIKAYRAAGVAGTCPWTLWQSGFREPFMGAVQRAYEPNGAFVREYDRRFYAGERVERTIDLYNDTMEPAELELHWQLDDRTRGAVRNLHMRPAEHRRLRVEVPMPEVDALERRDFTITVLNDGEPAYEGTHDYWISPRGSQRFDLPAHLSVAVLRSGGAALRFLREAGLEATVLGGLAQVEAGAADLLVVEAGALGQTGQAPVVGSPDADRLARFAEAGGTVIVLEQAADPLGALPLALTHGPATMAFAAPGAGRVLSAPEGWFRFWRGDHYVGRRSYARPERPGLVLVEAGGRGGLEKVLLAEVPTDAGRFYLCQLLVGQKLRTEPAAARLLADLVRAAARPPERPADAPAGRPAYGSVALAAGDMQIDSPVHFVRGRRVDMRTEGGLSARMRFARTGAYRFRVDAGGSPAEGRCPNVRLLVDGRSLGDAVVPDDGAGTLDYGGRVEAGEHRVELRFTNDLYTEEEDRNLWVDELRVRPPE
ncbi:MAG: glycoside hydrolase family 2 TIM barrel-domain containing protein [Planctomycetota bacterium]